MSQEERSGARAKVEGLRVKYKSATIDAFLDDAFDDLGAGGMFIRTESPFPVTTLLKFEVQLSNTEVALAGVGRVAWIRTKAQAEEQLPAGMGIKFIKVDDKSRQLIDAVVQRGSAGADYVKGVRDSIRVAQAEQGMPTSISSPANLTIISVPPPASRDAYRERSNTLMGIGSPSVPAPSRPPGGVERAPMVVPTPSYTPEDASTKRLLPDSTPPSSFGADLSTEIWRRPDALLPSARPASTPPGAGPARIVTPSSLRPARLATPAPPPASIPPLSQLADGPRRAQPHFRAPSAPPPAAKSGFLTAFVWGVALLGLGALGFWFGTRGSVEHVEPKADIIRPAIERASRVESAPSPSERVVAIQTPDATVPGMPSWGVSPLPASPVGGRALNPALLAPQVSPAPSPTAADATPVQTAPKPAETIPAPVASAPVQTAPKPSETMPAPAGAALVPPAPKAAETAPQPAAEAPKPAATPAPTAPKSSDAG